MSNTHTQPQTIWFGNGTGKCYFINVNEQGEMISTNAPIKDAQKHLLRRAKASGTIVAKGSIIEF